MLSSRNYVFQVPGFVSDILSNGAHMTEYAGLAAAIGWALEPSMGKRAYLWAIMLAVIYGATDEFHQSFVPGRDADAFDLIPDTLGAIIGIAVLANAKRRRTRPSS